MQFAASFVEYLITGCTALLWLIPLWLAVLGPGLPCDVSLDKYVLVLLPVLYVVGMLVDSISSELLQPLKPVVRGTKKQEQQTKRDGSLKDTEKREDRAAPYSNTVFILYHSPELGKAMLAHTSRDRIARGAFLNSLLAFCITLGGNWGWQPSLAALVLTIVLFAMWWRFERLSHDFKQHAVEIIVHSKMDAGT